VITDKTITSYIADNYTTIHQYRVTEPDGYIELVTADGIFRMTPATYSTLVQAMREMEGL